MSHLSEQNASQRSPQVLRSAGAAPLADEFDRALEATLASGSGPTPQLRDATRELVQQLRQDGLTANEVEARITTSVQARISERSYNAPARRATLGGLLAHWAREAFGVVD